MKKLICDMCDGTDFIKQDGVFVCQTCGMKYSVEEARKMMREGEAAPSSAFGETAAPKPSAPAPGDNQQVQVLLDMAKSAYRSGNAGEAISYANRVIELDTENYEAWLLKGLSAGWESNLRTLRLQETQQCLVRAAYYVPADAIGTFWENAANDYTQICLAIVKLYCEHLAEFPGNDTAKMLSAALTEISSFNIFYAAFEDQNLIQKFVGEMTARGTAVPVLSSTEILTAVIGFVNKALQNTHQKYLNAYKAEKFPDKTELERFLEKTAAVIWVLGTVDNITANYAQFDPALYQERIIAAELQIRINNDCMEVRGWEWKYCDYNPTNATDYAEKAQIRRQIEDRVQIMGGIPDGDGGAYYPNFKLTSDAVSSRRKENSRLNHIIAESKTALRKAADEKQARERSKKQQRIDAYWTMHAEEKRQLEEELDILRPELIELREKIRPFEEQIEQIQKKGRKETPSQIQKKENAQRIADMTAQKEKLGIFKGKEKKSLQEQIEQLRAAEPGLDRQINEEKKALAAECQREIDAIEQEIKPLRDRIAEVYSRISEIDSELTMDRK